MSFQSSATCRAGSVLKVGVLAENRDGTRYMGLETEEMPGEEAGDTRTPLHLRALGMIHPVLNHPNGLSWSVTPGLLCGSLLIRNCFQDSKPRGECGGKRKAPCSFRCLTTPPLGLILKRSNLFRLVALHVNCPFCQSPVTSSGWQRCLS